MTTEKQHIEIPALMDENATAAALGVTPKALRNWRVQGRGPAFVKIGANVRYRAADIAEFIEKNTVTSTAAFGRTGRRRADVEARANQ